MKKIDELTEQEILVLTEDQIDMMINIRKAEEGIQFNERPVTPVYLKEEACDMSVFYCGILGDKMVFTSIDELTKVLELLKTCSIFASSYGNKSVAEPFETESYSLGKFQIQSKECYSKKLFKEVEAIIKTNATVKKNYDEAYKEYSASINASNWISEEIWNRVKEVKDKYYQFETFTYKFVNDYLPLAENSETIAMGFLKKAYTVDEEAEIYILKHYFDKKKL